jgi:membrane-associated protease RseP (regulator of RpoE activity)
MFPSAGFSVENGKADTAAGSSSDKSASHDDDDVEHHAALGVSFEEVAKGLRIVAVMPGSPAARAGLRVGDEIRFVGDQRVRTTQELIEEIGKHRPGSQVDLTIRRNGERQTLTAKLASQTSTFGNRGQSQPPGQGPRSYAYGPNGQPSEQQLSQQIRALQQQVYRLQQMIDQQQSGTWRGARQWSSEQRHGEGNDDPSLFQ